MKKDTSVKYPHSANLFQFCRKVLDHKFGGVRVIDQDVGQILGFDPADCSHWKKGKKNIRSIQAMKSIAEHLGVDEKLVVDVANGEMNDWEAYYEFSGYGSFEIGRDLMESARKDFYKRHANTWTREKEQDFKRAFCLQEEAINALVLDIHKKVDFNEAPLYLPEVCAAFPHIKLKAVPNDAPDSVPVVVRCSDGDLEIEFPDTGRLRSFARFKIAKAIGVHFMREANLCPPEELGDYADHVQDIQANLFAAKLLTPAPLIRRELVNINFAKDIVSQLAEIFWVSKTFMNNRLKEILQNSPSL